MFYLQLMPEASDNGVQLMGLGPYRGLDCTRAALVSPPLRQYHITTDRFFIYSVKY